MAAGGGGMLREVASGGGRRREAAGKWRKRHRSPSRSEAIRVKDGLRKIVIEDFR